MIFGQVTVGPAQFLFLEDLVNLNSTFKRLRERVNPVELGSVPGFPTFRFPFHAFLATTCGFITLAINDIRFIGP